MVNNTRIITTGWSYLFVCLLSELNFRIQPQLLGYLRVPEVHDYKDYKLILFV